MKMKQASKSFRRPIRQLLGSVALLSGLLWQGPLQAATETATVTAEIISTISLVNQADMVFGQISSSFAPGRVELSPDGARLGSGGVGINSSVPGGPAVFDVRGNPNAVFAITLPASVVMTAPSGNTLLVDRFTSLPAGNGLTDAGGQQTLSVGATLNVGNNQVVGSYSGQMAVTVDYN